MTNAITVIGRRSSVTTTSGPRLLDDDDRIAVDLGLDAAAERIRFEP